MAEALRFYLDNGLDEVIGEDPCNYYERKEEAPVVAQKSAPKVTQKDVAKVAKKPFVMQNPLSTGDALANLAKRSQKIQNSVNKNDKFMSLNEIVEKARQKAQSCKDLSELRQAVEDFDGCSLKKMATNTVFCDGNPDSKVMVIGEAPGNNEDLQGVPFCGDSGKLLDAMFASINRKRADDYYITNVLFWRPPGNRRPTDEELAMCRPFVERHIELIDPKMMILVGGTAMTAVLGLKDPVSGVRGKVIEFDAAFMGKKIPSFVIFHPSYLMRQSGKKRVVWRDLLELERVLG